MLYDITSHLTICNVDVPSPCGVVLGPGGIYMDVGNRPSASVVDDPPVFRDAAIQVVMSAEAPHDDPVYDREGDFVWVRAGNVHTLYIPDYDSDDSDEDDDDCGYFNVFHYNRRSLDVAFIMNRFGVTQKEHR